MQTLKQATGHDILSPRNFWQPTVHAPEIEVVKFVINENVDIRDLMLNAFNYGMNPIVLSVSRTAGDFSDDAFVVDYSKNIIGALHLTTIEDLEFIPPPPPPEGWRPGEQPGHAVNYIGKGTFFINAKAAGDNQSQLNPRITIVANNVTVSGGVEMNQPTQLDAIESKLDYLIGK